MAKAALKQQKQAQAAERIDALPLPEGGGWITAARTAARERLRDMGLPHGRDEYWKWTRPATLTSAEVTPAKVFSEDEDPLFGAVDCLKVVFRDGVFDAAASDPLDMAGLEIERLAEAGTRDIHWAKDLYGTLEAASHEKADRPLLAFNTAYASDGLVIRATGKAAKPVHVVYLRESDSADANLRHLVKVEEGAELTLLETGAAAARFFGGLEVDVADCATFHHVRSQGRDHEKRLATAVLARLGAESVFKSFTLCINGALSRNEAVVEFTGDDAVAHVAGAALGDGSGFHNDDTVFVTHDAVNCESRQVFKKVLRNGATGVFQGKILVRAGAQKTDGYQISQSLLLDGDSTFLAKPELEIYADDVACSHGSTSGAIDDTALFYLRSRGVPERDATNLLTLAFIAEALEEIDDDALADELRERLAGWLDRHAAG